MAQQPGVPTLSRQGSVVRSDAIAKLKRAASQREVKASPLHDPLHRSDALKHALPSTGAVAGSSSNDINSSSVVRAPTTLDGYLSPKSYDLLPAPGAAALSMGVGGGTSQSGHSNGSSDVLPSPSRSPQLSRDRAFNRSPLPSLEQLRARILQERETAGTSTSAASQAARAYALEKLLGNSGEDVFTTYPLSGAAAAATPSNVPKHANDSEDIASDDENQSDLRTRRQSVMSQRPSLRRSMSVNSFVSISDTHRKANFAQALDVPSPPSNRISRIRQRRIERDSVAPAISPTVTVNQPSQLLPSGLNSAQDTAQNELLRTQSQRQMARTQLLRKLSTRGRGAPPQSVQSIEIQNQVSSPAGTPKIVPPRTAEDKDSLSPLPTPVNLPSPSTSAKQSSPSLFSDEEELEDDAFYKLYSPAIGYGDDLEEDDDGNQLHTPDPSPESHSLTTSLIPQVQMQEAPKTPPQQFAYRQSAAVPYDPSPGTDADVTEMRRSRWMSASPSGVTVPLRFSNSLISNRPSLDTTTSYLTNLTKDKSDPSTHTTAADQPIPSNNRMYAHSDSSRKYQGSLSSSNHSGSPALASLDDKSIDQRAATVDIASDTKPSERLQAILGSSFVHEYAADLDLDNPSKVSLHDHDVSADANEMRGLGVHVPHMSRSSPASRSLQLKDDLSDGDVEVDEDYLCKVDRIADKLKRFAQPSDPHTPSARETDVNLNAEAASTERREANKASLAPEPMFEMENIRPVARAVGAQAVKDEPSMAQSSKVDRPDLAPGMAQRMREQLQEQKKAASSGLSLGRPLPDPPRALLNGHTMGDSTSLGSQNQTRNSEQRPSSPGKDLGLFSSLRRKASGLRRIPSSAKDKEGGFWSRRNGAAKNSSESPKLPSEPSFISAPILRHGDGSSFATEFGDRNSDARITSADELQTVDAGQNSWQRNGSVSSVGSARLHADLQDGTADTETSTTLSYHASLDPGAAAMIHRYSRMLTATKLSTSVPGVTMQHMRDPPRRFLLAEPVFQVISATTIKDRFLFLFSDLLIIAKPLSSSEVDTPLGRLKGADILPSLDWTFAVKNILELHRLKVSITSSTRTAQAKTRAQNTVLWSFVRQFSQDTDTAVRTLTAKMGLNESSTSFAQILYQTPELDRAELTRYLCRPNQRRVLKEYVAQHRYVGVSIESALRNLLLDLRFPTELDAFEALLVNFAHSWTAHNAATIKTAFTEQIASDLVFAIMALNDALHTNVPVNASVKTSPGDPQTTVAVTPGLFSAPCHDLSKDDFVHVFRQHDPLQVLSDRTLSRIYLSIRSEPLAQALDRHEARHTIRIKDGKLPTRMTYAQPAEPVTLVLPAPDPDLAIRLYAQDTTFEPPILTFSHSREASFTMWSKHLGPKQVVFVRAGRNARFYSGIDTDLTDQRARSDVDAADRDYPPLPRNFSVTVERAFMKHSFTLSSVGSASEETRRFMFSFENADRVGMWTSQINAAVAACSKAKVDNATHGSETDVLKRATETIALQVLRDNLIVQDDVQAPTSGVVPPSLNRAKTITGTLHHNRATADGHADIVDGHAVAVSGHHQLGHRSVAGSRLLERPGTSLDRAPSTSRHYYAASGVGRHERELLIPPSASSTNSSMMSGSSSSGQIHTLAMGGGAASTRPQHIKGSASLSTHPAPHAAVDYPVRINAIRSASAQKVQQIVPPRPLVTAASTGPDKVLLGTQIVSVVRLNSLLLSTVLAHHQFQTQPPLPPPKAVSQQQQQQQQQRYR